MTGIAQILNKTSPLQPNKQVVSVYLADSSEISKLDGLHGPGQLLGYGSCGPNAIIIIPVSIR